MGLIKRMVRKKVQTPAKRLIRRKVTRPARKKIRRAASVKCGTCRKRYANPLTHVCTVRTDFRRRKAAAERRARAAAARARKKAAAARRKAAAAERRKAAAAKRSQPAAKPPARAQHDYRTCRDGECRRHACVAFREGYEARVTDERGS